jgi:hypothetical protein
MKSDRHLPSSDLPSSSSSSNGGGSQESSSLLPVLDSLHMGIPCCVSKRHHMHSTASQLPHLSAEALARGQVGAVLLESLHLLGYCRCCKISCNFSFKIKMS